MKKQEFEKWLGRFKNLDKKVELKKPKKTAKRIFLRFKKKLQGMVGKRQILWLGSEPLGLIGKGEFDIYVIVSKNEFAACMEKLEKHFKPGVEEEKGRMRFNTSYYRNDVEIHLCTDDRLEKSGNLKFFNKLKNSLKLQREYERIKLENAVSKRAYLEAKNTFIEKVLKS